MYGTEVSPDVIRKVTDKVMAEVTAWLGGHSNRCIQWCSSMRCE
jgi:transposase-like protein